MPDGLDLKFGFIGLGNMGSSLASGLLKNGAVSPENAMVANRSLGKAESFAKRYPGVTANDGVSLEVAAGEIHAILGENGAGKSTLVKIIAGAVAPDAGTIELDGRPVVGADPAAARALGVAMVYQHFSLFDSLTVAENVALGLDRRLARGALVQAIRDAGERYGLRIDPAAHVHDLSMGERQRVEIVRALLARPKLLILDEPTSVLTPQAVDVLFATLRQLAGELLPLLL